MEQVPRMRVGKKCLDRCNDKLQTLRNQSEGNDVNKGNNKSIDNDQQEHLYRASILYSSDRFSAPPKKTHSTARFLIHSKNFPIQ